MQCVQYATYNSLGGCSRARSALTIGRCKETEKLVRIEYSEIQSDNTDVRGIEKEK